MEWFDFLKWLHILGATVLIGTGAGIAFFMLMAHRTADAAVVAVTAHFVVVADALFTASAVVLQPVTGYLLAQEAGWSFTNSWLLLSLCLYVLTGLFWLPVVFIQIKMRNLARHAVEQQTALPPGYHRLFRIWFACGIPAFAAVSTILWLMIAKPDLWLS